MHLGPTQRQGHRQGVQANYSEALAGHGFSPSWGKAHPPVGPHDGLEVDHIDLAGGLDALPGVAAGWVLRGLEAGLAVHHKDVAGRLGLHPAVKRSGKERISSRDALNIRYTVVDPSIWFEGPTPIIYIPCGHLVLTNLGGSMLEKDTMGK